MKRLWEFYKNLLLENRNWLRFAAVLFALELLVGIVISFDNPDLMQQIIQMFEDKFGTNPALDLNLVTSLFMQNSTAAAIALFGGIVFGFAPFLAVSLNGLLLGYVTAFIQDPFLIAAGLVPHGILELPAFLIAAGFGFKFGWRWLGREASGARFQVLKQDFKSGLYAFPLIVLMLLFAAVIEVYISGNLLN